VHPYITELIILVFCQLVTEKLYTLLKNLKKGEWKNGERHGKGTMDYADGNKYTGTWVNGEKLGQGVFIG
jgi:hypothetical protein